MANLHITEFSTQARDSTEDKDAARQWLADYYGVTLP